MTVETIEDHWMDSRPHVHVGSSLQNSTNCPGARLVPSQVSVLILAP